MKELIATKDTKPELDRILDLPVDPRQPEDDLDDLVARYTDEFGKPGGEWTLRPVQALALDVLRECGAAIVSAAVGSGKTLISQLAPKALGLSRYSTVLFTKAKLIDPWMRALEENRQHFGVERYIYVESYAKLSHPDNGPRLLEELSPDLIIADECHALAGEDSCRRSRFERYFEDHPDTGLLAMSGTITKKSIEDWAHLAEMALGPANTPLPTTYSLMEDFKACVDAAADHEYASDRQWDRLQPLVDLFGSGRDLLNIYPLEDRREVVRDAFYERVSTAPGIVHTSIDTVGASLQIDLIGDLTVPPSVREAIRRADKEFILPNDDEIEDPLAKARAIKQIAQGVFYFWDWPGEPDWEWVDTRRAKSREIRRAIKETTDRDVDSPTLVKREIEAGNMDHDPALLNAWREWQPHRHKDAPPTRPEWISEYMIEDVTRRAKRHGARPPAIVWYRHRYVAEKLADQGLTWYDPNDNLNPELANPQDGPIVLSIDSHSEGLNLQKSWSRNIVLCPPSDGATWEQMLGRTHRAGQSEDTVTVEIYAHVPAYRDAIKTARKRARYISEANGQQQKLLIADWLTLP